MQQQVSSTIIALLFGLALLPAGSAFSQVQDAVSVASLIPVNRDAGWHFGFGFGTVAWGSGSVCDCAAMSLDVAVAYESNSGLGLEYKPTFTNTTTEVIDQALNAFYYPRLGKLGSPFGVYGGLGQLLPLNNNFNGERTGSSYGYGVRARAALGKRGKTRVFGDVGVLTFRQRFEFEEDWRPVTFRQVHVHSGLRVRVGVVW